MSRLRSRQLIVYLVGVGLILLLLLCAWLLVWHRTARAEDIDLAGVPRLPARHLPDTPAYAPGRLVVKFRDELAATKRAARLSQLGLATGKHIAGIDVELVDVPAGQEPALAAQLRRDPTVLYAEPDYTVYALKTPNDTYYGEYQWNMRRIGMENAWNVTTGASSTVIAIVDSGVDLTHPDLASKLLPGYDFVNGDSQPQDDEGHGTHVAGIAAAVSNNGLGVAGVSWGSKILPIKVLDSSGHGDASIVAQGIWWAADQGAQIINLSLGSNTYSNVLKSAVDYAYSKGCLIVAAAGNEYQEGNPPSYPAAFSHVLAVGAVGNQDEHARYSNTGAYVDVVAPGGNPTSDADPDWSHWILSTHWRGSGYDYVGIVGTSQAAPHVSGLAALIWSINPMLTNDQVEALILTTAVDLGSTGWDETFGWGRINAAAAVTSAQQGAPTPTPTATPPCATFSAIESPAEGDTVFGVMNVTGWVADFQSAYGTGISNVEVWMDGLRLGRATYGLWRQDIADQWGARFGPSGFTFAWDTRLAADGAHTLAIRALTSCGQYVSAQRNVHIRNTCQIALHLDGPQPDAILTGIVELRGWTVDQLSTTGTGIDQVSLWLDGPRNQGIRLGDVTAFLPRPDIGALLGANFRDCGFAYRWYSPLVPNGAHTLYVYAHSPICGWYGPLTRTVQVQNPVPDRYVHMPIILKNRMTNPPTPTPTATATATPTTTRTVTPTASPTATPLYFDNFDDPSSDWPVIENTPYRMGYLAGEYQILIKATSLAMPTQRKFQCRDCAVEVDGRLASAARGDYGVVFDILPSPDLYLFRVNAIQEYSLFKVSGGGETWTPLVSWTGSPAIRAGGAVNRLRLAHLDDQVVLYVNGQRLTSVRDPALYGYIRFGLAAAAYSEPNVDARFDNLAVYPVGSDLSFSRVSPEEMPEVRVLPIPN